MNMFEFKYAGEILRAFSDENRVRILRRLRVREESILALATEGRTRDGSFDRDFSMLERAGLVVRMSRDGAEYARINPKLSGLVENYFSARH
jgi:DNA-binding transcriptional ArsR family regulator